MCQHGPLCRRRMVIMNKFQVFLGIILAEYAWKGIFCSKSKQWPTNSSAAIDFFLRPYSFSIQLITYLFVKLPWPGDSEGTFSVFKSKLSRVNQWPLKVEEIPLPTVLQYLNPKKQQANLLVYFHTILLMLKIKQENCEQQFYVFWFDSTRE